MKRKQLTALVLSAAMVLSNAGISFGAWDVGNRGATGGGQTISVTLDANGGMFHFLSEDAQIPATPSDATPSDASSSDAAELVEKTSTTLDVEGTASSSDNGAFYLPFMDANPAYDSANSNWNVLTDGPEETVKDMKFAGWYGDPADLTTKLDDESRVYEYGVVKARWVNLDQVTVDESVKNQIQNPKVSGLADGLKLNVKGLAEDQKRDAPALTEMVNKADLSGLGVTSVELSKEDGALIQLDISVTGGTVSGSVGITINDPFNGRYEKVLVIHLSDDAETVKDVQYAVLDQDGTLSFTAKGFSPYILAGVDSETGVPATIKVENVKNGALIVYSETPLSDGTVKRTYVPIGEEVQIPVGTLLFVDAEGAYSNGNRWELKDYRYQVKEISDGTTQNISDNVLYEVTGDAIISGEFVKERALEITPMQIPAPAVYEGEVSCYGIEADGTKTSYQVHLLEDRDDIANDLFTLENGVLKSKNVLPLGEYELAFECENSEYLSYRTIRVGRVRIEADSDYIPKAGPFKTHLKVSFKENGKWVSKDDWSIELDSDWFDALDFSLENHDLKSKEDLPLGSYYPHMIVTTPEGGSYRIGVGIDVGIGGYFYAALAKYERTSGDYTYTNYISDSLSDFQAEEGLVFADVKDDVFVNSWEHVSAIDMYGHPFTGWMDEDGNTVADTLKLERYNDFYAFFKDYTPVTVEVTDSAVKPVEPEKPGKPDDSGDSDSSDDSGSGSGGSSSGNRRSFADANTISGNWQRDAKGWWFQLSGGGYARNQWGKVNNVWYYFNDEGYLATGWQQIDGKWYYLTETEKSQGAMATGWQQIGGQWYYLTETDAGQGSMVTGWHFDTRYQKWFYLSTSGAMATGWQQIDGQWYYLNAGSDGIYGAMAANTTIGGYRINANGVWVQ